MSMEVEALIRRQLDAYNARDIDAFMFCWAENAEVFAHPDIPLASGRADIRARHVLRFREPDLYAHLVSRIVMGNRVIDTELVTRNFPEGLGQVDVVGIYEVENNKITKAWFLMGEPRLASSSASKPA